MTFWKSTLVILSSTLLVTACGGGADEATEETEAPVAAAPVEEAPAAPAMLGGGAVTLVHEGQAGSPHVQVAWEVDGANLSVTYGRPYLRDRTVGESVEPMDGQIWRLGADEATTLSTSGDLMVGSVHVPVGDYTLWTLTSGETTELIVNSETGQWGTAYDDSQDLGRTEMTTGNLDSPAEQLTIFVESNALRFEWGTMVASVPLTVH